MSASSVLDILLNRAQQLLSERFGHASFLSGQTDALRSVLSKRSLLVVMPTGSGKSLLYQLPALMEGGLTLVVSPLIALMKDQVDELARKGVPATFVNSSLSAEEQRSRLEACATGGVRLLYVAPERFQSAAFLNMLRRARIARMAVDEAHCISEWGHDFRPDYRRLKGFREQMGRPPVTALTATATPAVQQDIIESLGLAPADVDRHVHGFDRPNLHLRVARIAGDAEKEGFLARFIHEHAGSGIIYAGTRKLAEELAETLRPAEPTVAVYHAGMDPAKRTAAQEAFLGGRSRVVLATMAFGMGIDKPDVRFVVHVTYPASVEQYYQEIGRAGRDGRPSDCVLLHDPGDRRLREFFIDLNYPPKDMVRSVCEALDRVDENPVMRTYREIAELCDAEVKDGHVGAAVRLLDEAGVTRAFTGDPTIAVTTSQPAADLLARVKGPAQRRVFEALSVAADLEVPGRYELELHTLCSAAGLGEDAVRRALSALDHESVIRYEPPFRGRGVEKLKTPLPPFEEIAIDWARQTARREEEERKLALMEDYLRTTDCRRAFILRYFGETTAVECSTCDRCDGSRASKGGDVLGRRPEVAKPALVALLHLRFPVGKTLLGKVLVGSREKRILEWRLDQNPAYGRVRGKHEMVKPVIDELIREGYVEEEYVERGSVLRLTGLGARAAQSIRLDDAQKEAARAEPAGDAKKVAEPPASLESAVLRCLSGLKAPVGAGKVAEVLTGSKAEWIDRWNANRLDVYGTARASREDVQGAVRTMIEKGLLDKAGTPERPVLVVTESGKRAMAPSSAPAARATTPPAETPAETPAEASAPRDAAERLDAMLRELLTAEADRAKALLPELRLYHPREISRRVAATFDATTEPRVQKRAAWAAGELGGPDALPFLLRAAASETADVRRIAASAIGKATAGLSEQSRETTALLGDARRALEALGRDVAPQVVQYARKALSGLPRQK